MEGCGRVDEGSDDRPANCDDEGEGPAAQDGTRAEGRDALCVPAAGTALFCKWDEDFDGGDGWEKFVLVSVLPGGVAAPASMRDREAMRPR